MKKFLITLKAARVNAGFGLLEAAKRLGIGKDTLMKWERHPELINLIWQKKIATVYSIPIDVIFFGQRLELDSSNEGEGA